MHRSDQKVSVLETRRNTHTGGGEIRAGVQGRAVRMACGAVAGMSSHAPMT